MRSKLEAILPALNSIKGLAPKFLAVEFSMLVDCIDKCSCLGGLLILSCATDLPPILLLYALFTAHIQDKKNAYKRGVGKAKLAQFPTYVKLLEHDHGVTFHMHRL